MKLRKHISEIQITIVCSDEGSGEETRTEEVSWFSDEVGGLSQDRLKDALTFIMDFLEMRVPNKGVKE